MFIIAKRVPGQCRTEALVRYGEGQEMEARREVSRLRGLADGAIYTLVRVPERREIEV